MYYTDLLWTLLAENLGGCLPVIKGKPESNMLLESDVADEDRAVESSRLGPRERQTLDVDVGMGVGGVGEWSGLIGVGGGSAKIPTDVHSARTFKSLDLNSVMMR